MAVRYPDLPGQHLLGDECDGAAYFGGPRLRPASKTGFAT
jgi:hypothetical protein